MSFKSLLVGTLVSTISIFSSVSAMMPETVVDVAVWSDAHTTLVTAVLTADLAETLSWDGPFTVFAPVNDAFSQLPEWTVEMLLKPENIDTLRSILTYHVVPGKVMSTDLSQGLSAATVQWEQVTFTHSRDMWYVNGAQIMTADIIAGNGVVHIIDSVIMPPMSSLEILSNIYKLRGDMDEVMEDKVDAALIKYGKIINNFSIHEKIQIENRLMMDIDGYIYQYSNNYDIVNMLMLLQYEIMLGNIAANDIVDIALWSNDHTTLVTAVVEAELVDTLKSDGPFTLFAPVNNAFSKLPAGTVEWLLSQESKADLTNILSYHVVAGAYVSSDITDWLMLQTVQGESLEFTISNGVVSINGMPTLVTTDIATSNGIVHVIGDVLIPSGE
jgi:transforming growth factor-beta-induced protein